MLLNPNCQFIKYIEESAHYLNCPKHMFNDQLNSVYRQGVPTNESEKFVEVLLTIYHYPEIKKTAKEIVAFFKSITFQEFRTLNVNPYVENLPERMVKRNDEVNAYIENGTTYYHGMFGGGVCSVPSYPFRRK